MDRLKHKKMLSIEEIGSSVIMILLLTIIYIVVCSIYITEENVTYCYNDVYCYLQSKSTIPMLMVAEFYIIYNFKYEWRTNFLIRQKSMKAFWCHIIKKNGILSGIITLYSFIVCSAYAGFNCVYECNWLDRDSEAFHMFLQDMTIRIDTWIIQLIYIITVFAEVFVIGIIIVILWWWLRQPIYGYGAMVAFASFENGYWERRLYIFFNRISMDNSYMYLKGYNIYDHIIFPIVMIAAACIVGAVLFRKRDMLRKDSDV